VGLAGAGRPLHGDVAVLREAARDGLLGLVRRQRHEQPLPQPLPLLRPVVGHAQLARLVRHDGGERADPHVTAQEPVAQTLEEAAEQPLFGPDEEHAGVHNVRAGGDVTRRQDEPVVAEPGQRALEQIAALGVVPDIELQRAGRAGQRDQLSEEPLVQTGQRVGLQPWRSGRRHRDQ
jgi:hypothetical protein